MEDVFKALGDVNRLRILGMLAEDGETCVCVFTEQLGMGQSAVSHHLASLKRAGLVHSRRQGQWIHYSLNVDAIKDGPLAFLKELVDSARQPADKDAARKCC